MILSLFFLHLADCYLIWKIYKGFKKQIHISIQSNSDSRLKFYEGIIKIFKITFGILLVYIFFLVIEKLFSDSEFVWKSKWIVNLLYETIALIVFSVLVFFLQSSYVFEDEGYVQELETDSHINHYNISSSRSVDIK